MTSNDTEPRRRSLIRGVAWAAPTMAAAVAAPAIAVSTPCAETDVTLNWGMSAYSGTPSATSTFTTNVRFNPTASSTNNPDLNNPMTATIVHRWFGNARGDGPNGTISTFNVGGTNQVGYYLRQQVGPNGATAPTTADYQTIQVTFSEVVRNLRFSITDIDRVWAPGAYDFIDGVSLTSSSPFTSRAPSGSTVTGAGNLLVAVEEFSGRQQERRRTWGADRHHLRAAGAVLHVALRQPRQDCPHVRPQQQPSRFPDALHYEPSRPVRELTMPAWPV